MTNNIEDPVVEVFGKTGKPKLIHISDISLNEHIVRNDKTGKFEPYISRWYRLPGEYDNEYDALQQINKFMRQYYL